MQNGQAICTVPYEQTDGIAVMGGALAATQIELRRLSARVLTIQENERRRIATDLHDGLGQSLTLIRLQLEECSALLAANKIVKAEESLQQLKHKVQHAFGELRHIAMDLRPSTLDDLGIIATLSWFFRELENACCGIKIEKNLMAQERNIPVSIKTPIFRILQEATNNIVKHAKADHIRVSLRHADDTIQLSIEDNGQGFDLSETSSYRSCRKGIGLESMRERANASGGTYRIDSAISHGTRISVTWSCG